MNLYANGRHDAEHSDIDAEVRLIHNVIGMHGEYRRGWRDWVNEQRAARGLTTFFE